MLNFPIEPFGPQHDRCGNEALDRHFHERIRKEVDAGAPRVLKVAV